MINVCKTNNTWEPKIRQTRTPDIIHQANRVCRVVVGFHFTTRGSFLYSCFADL